MASTTAKALFERGKSCLEKDKKDEALRLFSEAVRIEPQNADYHAWLARALSDKHMNAESFGEANHALQLNPRCQLAYRIRAAFYRRNKDYQKAIQDYSQAIQLDSQDPVAFHWRGKVHLAVGDYENWLLDNAQYFLLSSNWGWEDYKSDAKFNLWYATVRQHFTQNLLSRLKVGDEKYLGHWPCQMSWGQKSEVRSHDGNAYTMKSMSYGSGYFCLTNRNIYLFSFGQISKQFPLFEQGILRSVLEIGFANMNRRLESADQAWTVPYPTVRGAQLHDRAIQLTTPAMTWDIYCTNPEEIPGILAAINLGASGKYANHEAVSKPSGTAQTANTSVIDLLKQLGELKAQGIITDTEFEAKKKELLARL